MSQLNINLSIALFFIYIVFASAYPASPPPEIAKQELWPLLPAAKLRPDIDSAYCRIALDQPKMCTFVTRVRTSGESADWMLFNHKCALIQLKDGAKFPITLDTNSGGMQSPLPYVTSTYQVAANSQPWINHAGDYWYPGTNDCFNAGPLENKNIVTDFRLACQIRFDCSRPNPTTAEWRKQESSMDV